MKFISNLLMFCAFLLSLMVALTPSEATSNCVLDRISTLFNRAPKKEFDLAMFDETKARYLRALSTPGAPRPPVPRGVVGKLAFWEAATETRHTPEWPGPRIFDFAAMLRSGSRESRDLIRIFKNLRFESGLSDQKVQAINQAVYEAIYRPYSIMGFFKNGEREQLRRLIKTRFESEFASQNALSGVTQCGWGRDPKFMEQFRANWGEQRKSLSGAFAILLKGVTRPIGIVFSGPKLRFLESESLPEYLARRMATEGFDSVYPEFETLFKNRARMEFYWEAMRSLYLRATLISAGGIIYNAVHGAYAEWTADPATRQKAMLKKITDLTTVETPEQMIEDLIRNTEENFERDHHRKMTPAEKDQILKIFSQPVKKNPSN